MIEKQKMIDDSKELEDLCIKLCDSVDDINKFRVAMAVLYNSIEKKGFDYGLL